MAANTKFSVATHIITAIAYLSKCGSKELLGPRRLVCSKLLAESAHIHPVIIRRIVSLLAARGLVASHRGKGGGVKLSRPADKITLLDIYRAVGDEPIFAFNLKRPNSKCPVSSKIVQVMKPIFLDIERGIGNKLKSIKLSDLVQCF